MFLASDILDLHSVEIKSLSDVHQLQGDCRCISINFLLEIAAVHLNWILGKSISCAKAFPRYMDKSIIKSH